MLLSGFCGISYEILYARLLGNLIGDQFAVSATVLLTFLLGIGCGTLYAHHLWRFLWLLEASIGLFGVVFALGTDTLNTWLYSGMPLLGSGLGSIVLLCFSLLGFPAFLIGCSLPLFAGYLSHLHPRHVFAKAYTMYNFGAALTALMSEFWLPRTLGLRRAMLSIAAINGLIALSLLLGFGRLRTAKPETTEPPHFPSRHLVALGLSSIASAIFQLLMIKIAESFLGPFRETFALVLFLVLLGIALGSALAAKLRLSFDYALVATLAGLGWLLGSFGLVTQLYAKLYPLAVEHYPLSVILKAAALALLMGLPTLSFGATIPTLLTAQNNIARTSGQLLFVSSIANACGFLLMVFFLHKYLDYGVLIIVIAALTGASLTVYSHVLRSRTLIALVSLLLVVGVYRTLWNENLLYLSHTAFHTAGDLDEAKRNMRSVEKFKGYQDVFAINWIDGRPYFFINGYISIPLDSPSEKIVGAFASIFAPRTDNALVLGVGSGATAGTVGLLFDHTDAVEINPLVLKNLSRMSKYNFAIEANPRVTLFLDDAMHFTKVSNNTYSLIINTVTSPLYFSSSKLYTRDFFETIRQRLQPDGIYVTWADSRVGDRGMDIILQTLSQSFKDCWIGSIKASYFLLICSQQDIQVHHPQLIARNKELAKYFFQEHGLFPQWLPYGLLNTHAFALIQDPTTPINTLDYPVLEFEMARLQKRGIHRFKKRLREAMRVENVTRALQPVMDFHPLHLVLHTEKLLGDATITDRWKTLVARQIPDFDRYYRKAKLRYYATYAAIANTADAHHRYGLQLIRHGRYKEAIREFKTALKLNPRRNNSYFNIGSSYERLGQLELALVYYNKELLVDPMDEDVPFRVGRVYFKLAKYKEALAAFDTALSMEKTSKTYFYRGQALEALGLFAEAKQAYKAALQQEPDSHEARLALTRLADSSS
jgi:spermidine synthase/Tfp pilus assembly protein PilF